MLFKKFIMAGSCLALLSSCSNDSTDDLIDNTIVAEARYTEHVRPIIQNNCLACHGNPTQNGAPMSLTSYNAVRDAVENRGLIGRVSSPEGAPGHMPLGGPRLPQNLIDLIIQWEEQGFLE